MIPPSGKEIVIQIARLFALCHLPGNVPANKEEEVVLEAYQKKTLKVPSARQDGKCIEATLAEVQRHYTPHKRMLKIGLGGGEHVVCTEDHSLFSVGVQGHIFPFAAGEIKPGWSTIAIRLLMTKTGTGEQVWTNFAMGSGKVSVEEAPSEEYTYDLCVPGPENFFLANGILAHNSYSIGGVSLDIEKSSKYESLKQNAEGQFEKATETKMMTVKFIRGLRQPKYGVGIRSSFGPSVGRGVLSPRNFLVLPLFISLGNIFMEVLPNVHNMLSM